MAGRSQPNRRRPRDRRAPPSASSLAPALLRACSRVPNGIPRRYGIFRRLRRSEKRWYEDHAAGRNVNPLEVDLILLAILRGARELLRDPRMQRDAGSSAFAVLGTASGLQRHQILVDEMTDFSPVQLACMATLAVPTINSVFACGDFNQRITIWGIKTLQELHWVWPDIGIREVVVSYRQSRNCSNLPGPSQSCRISTRSQPHFRSTRRRGGGADFGMGLSIAKRSSSGLRGA